MSGGRLHDHAPVWSRRNALCWSLRSETCWTRDVAQSCALRRTRPSSASSSFKSMGLAAKPVCVVVLAWERQRHAAVGVYIKSLEDFT